MLPNDLANHNTPLFTRGKPVDKPVKSAGMSRDVPVRPEQPSPNSCRIDPAHQGAGNTVINRFSLGERSQLKALNR